MDLNIDQKRDKLLEEYSVGMLKDFYLTEYEKSPQEGFARASLAWSKYDGKVDKELAQRLYKHIKFVDSTYDGLKNPIEAARRWLRK